MAPSPWPSPPKRGRGKEKIRVNSLAPTLGESVPEGRVRGKSASLILVFLLAFSNNLQAAKLFSRSAKLLDGPARKQFTGYLAEICQWIMGTGLAGDSLTNVKEGQDSLAVRGNFARILVSGFELTKNNSAYLDEALRWGDVFASSQKRVVTSKGNEGGYWEDRSGKGTVDLGDISLDALGLARIQVYADGERKQNYRQALERYARFVTEGCKDDPGGKGRGGSPGWVIGDGEHKGAIANGYDESHLQTKPSTQATANQAALFAEIYAVTRNGAFRELAANAVHWILKIRKTIGDIPDYHDGQESDQSPMQTITSCSQSFLAASHLLEDAALNEEIGKQVEPTVRWLVRVQNDQGTWGEGPDEHRSAGVAALLAWFYLNVKADEVIPQQLDKFWKILLNPVHSQSFGVQMEGVPTGQVGLLIAEMVKPGITFKKM
jgi:hypothetical protein